MRKFRFLKTTNETGPLPDVPTGLTILHPDGDDGEALIDIITIHGFSGHPQLTWTNATTQHYWPLKSLPEDVPRSRIMTFGYNTSSSPFNRSTAIISDIARLLISNLNNKRQTDAQKKRPIIFVAHSLGGIVVKEFLHVSSNTGHESLADSVCGILFLGTPHKGSELASFMDVISAVTKTIIRRSPDEILKDLSSNSRHLLELDQLLRFRLGKIDIYSFYELLPLGSLKNPVVGRHSALLNIPSEIEQIGLEADHRQMCKPPMKDDFIYETIAQRIICIMNRQVNRDRYSIELMEMTNQFASRQIEYISSLTQGLNEQQNSQETTAPPSGQYTAHLNMSGFSETSFSLDRLADVLRSLPLDQVEDCIEAIQHLMKRASSLSNLLFLAERQNEQQRAEKRNEAQSLANQKIINDLLSENDRLRKELDQARHPFVMYPPMTLDSKNDEGDSASRCLTQTGITSRLSRAPLTPSEGRKRCKRPRPPSWQAQSPNYLPDGESFLSEAIAVGPIRICERSANTALRGGEHISLSSSTTQGPKLAGNIHGLHESLVGQDSNHTKSSNQASAPLSEIMRMEESTVREDIKLRGVLESEETLNLADSKETKKESARLGSNDPHSIHPKGEAPTEGEKKEGEGIVFDQLTDLYKTMHGHAQTIDPWMGQERYLAENRWKSEDIVRRLSNLLNLAHQVVAQRVLPSMETEARGTSKNDREQ